MSATINNMKQAVFEMFGVGSSGEVSIIPAQVDLTEEELVPAASENLAVVADAAVTVPTVEHMRHGAMSYIAAGSMFEGTIRCDGDVEVAGQFIGDIDAKGAVKLLSRMEGNVKADSLTLTGCSLTGNATVCDTLVIAADAEIHGNVSAKEVRCGGKIRGDLTVVGNATLERSAQIHGNIATGSFAVDKGAVICGGIEIKG